MASKKRTGGKSRWEPFMVRLDDMDIELLRKALTAYVGEDAAEKKAVQRLRLDLAATASDLWRNLP
jgi:hypothetical protein